MNKALKIIENAKKQVTYFDKEETKKRTIYWFEEDEIISLKEQLRLHNVSKSVNCNHPFEFVMSKCNGELNKCLKCGKQL